MRIGGRTFAILLALFALTALPAEAQDTASIDPGLGHEADGDRAWAAQDAVEAERAYRMAWDARPNADDDLDDRTAVLAVGLSRSLYALGRKEEAVAIRRRIIAARDGRRALGDTRLALLLMLEAQVAAEENRLGEAVDHINKASQEYFEAEQTALAGHAAIPLAQVLSLQGRHQEALLAAQTAIDYGGPEVRVRALVARGNAQVNLGDPRAGERDYIDALNLAPERDPQVLSSYASVLIVMGDTEAAVSFFTEALALFDAMGAAGAEYRAFVLDGLGLARLSQGRAAEAEGLFLLAIEAADDSPDGRRGQAHSRSNLSRALVRQGRLEEAEPLLRAAVADMATADGEGSYNWSTAVLALTDLLQKQGRHAEALPLIRRAYDAQAAGVGTQSNALMGALTQLGRSLNAVEGSAASEQAFRQSAELAWNSLPSGHPYVMARVLDFANQRLEAGEPLEALSGLRLASEAIAARMTSGGQTLQLQDELDASRMLFRVQVDAAWRLARLQ